MIDIYTIATNTRHLETSLNVKAGEPIVKTYQARPGMYMPVLIPDRNRKRLCNAFWGIPRLRNTIHTSKLLTREPYKLLVRTSRCAIPANCFFGMKDTDPYLIRLVNSRLFYLGGLFVKQGNKFSFIVLKTESADMLSFMPDMPVLMTADQLDVWLSTPELASVMYIADQAGSHWMDYYKVSSDILNPEANSRSLLLPHGQTYQQLKQREVQLIDRTFEKIRPNNSSGKR